MAGIRCTKRYGPPRWVFKVQSLPSLYYESRASVHVSDVTYEKIDLVCHDVKTATDSAQCSCHTPLPIL